MQSPQQGGWTRFAGKRVLLLQGPHGPFFARVAKALLAAGALSVDKVNFNGGDAFFYPIGAHAFRQSAEMWPAYLDALVERKCIDCVMVFGDCRPVHAVARTVARARAIQYWVFEEGYIRPNFITLEQHGVNGYSQLPPERAAYDAWPVQATPTDRQVPSSFGMAANYSMAYFTACTLARPWFWRYQHHRNLSMIDGLRWVRSFFRKTYYRHKERKVLFDLQPDGKRPYFLAILQVSSDAQVSSHSPYESVADFLTDTVRSFALHAKQDAVLVVKHHPMDRGYSDYSQLIRALRQSQRLGDRLRYIHDQALPPLLDNALGVVTINSTVGLSALYHATPVICMGKAIYNMPGLTFQGRLADFWPQSQAHRPDAALHTRFRNYVTLHTQINGNFYIPLQGGDLAGLHTQPADLSVSASASASTPVAQGH